jgi:hypothetical protein
MIFAFDLEVVEREGASNERLELLAVALLLPPLDSA